MNALFVNHIGVTFSERFPQTPVSTSSWFYSLPGVDVFLVCVCVCLPIHWWTGYLPIPLKNKLHENKILSSLFAGAYPVPSSEITHCACVCSAASAVSQLFAAPPTVARQAPLSMEFSRQDYWSGLPCLSPGDLSHPGIKLGSSALQVDSLPSAWPGKSYTLILLLISLFSPRYFKFWSPNSKLSLSYYKTWFLIIEQ